MLCGQRSALLEELGKVMATPQEKALIISTSDMQSHKMKRFELSSVSLLMMDFSVFLELLLAYPLGFM